MVSTSDLGEPRPSKPEPAASESSPGPLSLLEEASAQVPAIDTSLEGLRRIASDPNQDINDRLLAFEDMIESEIGDTTLTRARNIERETGLRQLFLKFDGGNPTGTQKDRIAAAQAMDALRRGFDAVTVATCGNYGAAMALSASLAGLRCVIYIPQSFTSKRIEEMTSRGAEIRRVPGDYEAAVAVSQSFAQETEAYDANPGGPNTVIQLKAYGEIAYEIYDELRDAPAVVAVPASNGTTVAGIYRGFQSLHRRGKTSRIPRIVSGSTYRKNPIIQAWLKNLDACEDLDPASIRETSVNEALINWHSIDGDLALEAMRDTNGWAGYGTDRSMTAMAKQIREHEGLAVLPASTAGIIALLNFHKQHNLPQDRYVAVLTGRRK